MSPKEKTLAYFPLNVSLLPGEDIPLRIYEPRYKQLINECADKGLSFGIPYVKGLKMQSFGSECRVKQIVATNSKGEMVIVVEGISSFEVLSFEDPFEKKLYSGGMIRILDADKVISDPGLIKLLIYYTDRMDNDFLKDANTREIRLNEVARALNLSSDDKHHFISLTDRGLQERFLEGHLRYLYKLREQEKLLKNDYFLN